VAETWSVDTGGAGFRTGPNEVGACASDLALDGVPNRACSRTRIWVDNVCPASPVPADRLTATFPKERRRAVVRSDRRARIAGRLVSEDGAPVSGATVCALTRIDASRAPVILAAFASTNVEGRYRLALPRGASRRVFVHHVAGSEVIARHGLAVQSRVRPTLAVNPRGRLTNGERLTFTGTLPGPACSRRVVKVQARVGARWQVFRTDRSDARCRFSARYRLRATSEPAVYRFHALVPPQAGYPYERGHSAARSVSVRG
jgi:hypothetical protein